jgi:hypothetical protein
MNNRYLFILPALTFILCLSALPAAAEVTVRPFGHTAALAPEDTLATTLTITNEGDAEVAFSVDMEEVDQGQRMRGGPRRDQPEGRFAVFQDQEAWGWITQWVFDLVDDVDYDSYRSADDLADVDLSQYDVLWVETGEQSNNFTAAWNDNLERFEEFVSDGGVMFIEQGWNRNHVGPIIGGLSDTRDPQEGELAPGLGQGGDQENWLVDQMGWNENQQFPGGSTLHCVYLEQDLDDIENCDWYQVIMVGQDTGDPGVVAYNYGRGSVVVSGSPIGHQWRYHNRDGEWGSCYEMMLYYLVYLTAPQWFIVEPDEGAVAAGAEQELAATFYSASMDTGTYEMTLIFTFTSGQDISNVMMSAVLTVADDVAAIVGAVTDAGTEEPVAGANAAIDRFLYARESDDDGNYALTDLPLQRYQVTFTAPDYLPHTEAIDLSEAGDHALNVALLHSGCTSDVDSFFYALEPDQTFDLYFSVTNNGNGPLTYWVDRRLLGEANAEPWELRRQYNAEDLFQNDRLNGVAFVDSLFYIAGGIRNQRGKIYIMDMDGSQVGSFDQWVASLNGMRDLTYDGELLWGADANKVIGFTTAGDSVTSFQGPWNPIVAMTWDPDRQLLWGSGSTTDIKAFDRQGHVNNDLTLNHPNDSLGIAGLKINGMSYYPDDPDGYNLWLVCNISDGSDMLLVKMNPETGGARIVRDMDDGSGDRPRGLFITNTFDVYSWVMMSISAVFGGDIPTDRLNIIQLDARKDWMRVTPDAGTIDAGATQDFTLTLDATGLPEVTFEGEVVFIHDGVGGETHIPVTLEVVQGQVHNIRRVNLHLGWNMVSVSLQPDSTDIPYLTAGLVESGSLRFMKDEDGNFYSPADEFNNIPGWSVSQGYLMKILEPATLTLEGMTVLGDDTIHLTQGWHIVAYYPRFAIDAELALAGITDHLVIAKDELGNFYVPAWDFSNMGLMRVGKGYQMKVDADVDLVYQSPQGMPQRPNRGENVLSVYRQPGKLPVPIPTGFNQSLLVLTEDVLEGDVGVYADGRLVGVGVLSNGAAGIAVWGDDPTTPELDGATAGEPLTIRMPGQSVAVELVQGDLTYRTDGFTVARLNVAETPTEFGIIAAYPNPFNARTRIVFSLPDAVRVNLAVYDIGGRLVANLADGKQEAGVHSALFDARDLPSGIYLVHLEAAGNVARQKLTLIK